MLTNHCASNEAIVAPQYGLALRGVFFLAFALALWNLSSTAGQAQTLQEEDLEQQGLAPPPTAGNWSVTLGVGVAGMPDYPGARAYRARPVPLVSIVYDRRIFLGSRGLGVNLIDWNGFHAGPVIGYAGGRSESDDPHLAGLNDISPSVTAGAFASYRFAPFVISGTVRQAITHTSNGLDGLVRADYVRPLIPGELDFRAGPDMEFADGRYERTWFGVTPTQSVQSGLPAYTPGAGVKDVGLHASLIYHYSEHILLRGFAAVKELTADAADSPIVQSKTQGLVGFGVAYHF